ncbi:hypothetical protein [Nocardia sp. NPDC005978]|uniref:hypothetical protein n=1 Tax=unclassified Nocardia TaxID=2637762 RepID=UPI0033B85859
MRVRASKRTTGIAVLLGAAAVTGFAGAATASAATPFMIPDVGAVGLELSPAETGSLADSPVPALADRYVPRGALSVGIQPDSALPRDGDRVFAGLNDIVREAASRPGGSVDVLVDSEGVAVLQVW